MGIGGARPLQFLAQLLASMRRIGRWKKRAGLPGCVVAERSVRTGRTARLSTAFLRRYADLPSHPARQVRHRRPALADDMRFHALLCARRGEPVLEDWQRWGGAAVTRSVVWPAGPYFR